MSDCNTTKQQVGLPPWVMTFADLMSLLLAFFVLLFSFSEVDKNVYKMLAGSLKDAFGVQREIRANEAPRGINIIATEFSPGRPTQTPYDEIHQNTTNDYRMYPVFTDPSEEGLESKNAKTEEAQDKSYNSRSDDNKADSNGYPEHLSADKNIAYIESKGSEPGRDKKEQASDVQHAADVSKNNDEQTNSGPVKDHGNAILKALEDEIMSGLIDLEVKKEQIIIRIREKASFPSGSADLIEPFKAITGRISDVFKDFDGLIIVSGHTDNVPIHTDRFRSNWELSSSRAVSVILELSKNKLLSNKRFKLAAYADTQPVDTNDTAKGRAKNRRVEITLDYSSLSDDMKEAASAMLKNGADNEDGTTNSRPMPGDHAGVVAR